MPREGTNQLTSKGYRNSLPDLPRRLAAGPLFFEGAALPHRVHRAPVPLMPEDRELSLACEALERLALEDRVGADVVERLPPEDEEAAVDPALVQLGLLAELLGELAADVQLAEAARRPNSGDRRELSLLAVELEERAQVDVGDAVAVRDHEFIALDVLAGAFDPSAGLRRESGLGEEDAPLLLIVKWLEVLDLPFADVNADVTVHRAVGQEVVADHVAFVAKTQDEIHDPEVRVELHDVPEDRPTADLDHRLRSHVRLLRQTRPESAAEDHRLHARHSTNG